MGYISVNGNHNIDFITGIDESAESFCFEESRKGESRGKKKKDINYILYKRTN